MRRSFSDNAEREQRSMKILTYGISRDACVSSVKVSVTAKIMLIFEAEKIFSLNLQRSAMTPIAPTVCEIRCATPAPKYPKFGIRRNPESIAVSEVNNAHKDTFAPKSLWMSTVHPSE